MVRFYFVFFYVLLLSANESFLHAQETIDAFPSPNANPTETGFISHHGFHRLRFIPSLPIQNTATEKDVAAFAEAKEKWINEVLRIYAGNISQAQASELREILRRENPEDIIQGKVLFIAE